MGPARKIHLVAGSTEFIKALGFHRCQFLDRSERSEVLSVNMRSEQKHIAASMWFVAIGASKNIVFVSIIIRRLQGSIDGRSTCWVFIGAISPPPMGIAIGTPSNCTKITAADPHWICICLGIPNRICVTDETETIEIRKIRAIRGVITCRLKRSCGRIPQAPIIWSLVLICIIAHHFLVPGGGQRLIPPLVCGIAGPIGRPSDGRLNPTKRMRVGPGVLLSQVVVMTGEAGNGIGGQPGPII